ASAEEVEYLCRFASDYLKGSVHPRDAVWTYSGVRPLYDDGGVSASTVTRDYVFDLDAPAGAAPLLSVFGGKLTTYRKLSEHLLSELRPLLRQGSGDWTRGAKLPGGDFPNSDLERFMEQQAGRYAFAPAAMIRRWCRAYGTRIEKVVGS